MKGTHEINKTSTLEVKEDISTGELYIELSDELLDESGFAINDTIEWIDNKNGSWTLRKVKPQPQQESYHAFIARKYKLKDTD